MWPDAQAPHVVLVTLDTTRADAISVGRGFVGPLRAPWPETPVLERLAREGVEFTSFFAHAPSTLSSHASLMLALDPHGHGVPRNGFVVPGGPPTLAGELALAGWDPIAVVGAAVLSADTGVGRGFRVFDDDLAGAASQPADQVVARALAAVDARRDDGPMFLWVHLYDPHAPYAPPPPFDAAAGPLGPPDPDEVAALVADLADGDAAPEAVERVNGAYLGEVAYADRQLGVLLDGLDDRGLLDPALIVVTGDHGEALGDDPLYAWSHGSHVADDVTRVPLILVGRGLPVARGVVVERQAAMSGLAPTVCELVGAGCALGPGSFASSVRAGPRADGDGWPWRPTTPVFLEATRPRAAEAAEGWNNARMQRGVRAGGFSITTTPFLGLEPSFDPGPSADEELRRTLTALLVSWDAAAPPHADAAPPTEALRSLGYVQ